MSDPNVIPEQLPVSNNETTQSDVESAEPDTIVDLEPQSEPVEQTGEQNSTDELIAQNTSEVTSTISEEAFVSGETTGSGVSYEELQSLLASMQKDLVDLRVLFETRLLYDKEKDQIIANQNKELQELRGDLRKKILQPVLMEIIHEIDLIQKQLPFFLRDDTPEKADKILKYLAAIPEDLLEILRNQHADEFIIEGTELFDPSRQKAVSLIPTSITEQNKRIAERILPGYTLDSKILRLEQVRVFKYSPEEKNNS